MTIKRKIFGYKLKEEFKAYNRQALEIAECVECGWASGDQIDLTADSSGAGLLETAGVLNIWFNEVYEKFINLVVGDWVITKDYCEDYDGKPLQILRIDGNYCWFNSGVDSNSNFNFSKDMILRKATSNEIGSFKKSVFDEAVRRFSVGTRFTPAHTLKQPDVTCIVTNSNFKITQRHGNQLCIVALTDDNDLYSNLDKYGNTGRDRIVYADGIWAKIENTPDITINGFKGMFLENHVKFGCALIAKNTILLLHQAIINIPSGSRNVGNINIGSGTFSSDEIIMMAEYYLNKK